MHGGLVATAFLAPRPPVPEPREIPVEVVRELPAASTPPSPVTPAPRPVAEPSPAAETQRASLERELAMLKAERAALKNDDGGSGPMHGSLRALALPSIAAEGGDGDVVDYRSLVFSQLAKAKGSVPPAGAAGVVGLRFSVDGSGRLLGVDVAVSSGIAGLDADALAIVRRAAPFPRPPAGAERVFSANVSYAAAR